MVRSHWTGAPRLRRLALKSAMTNRSLYWMRATTAHNFRVSNCEVATKIFHQRRQEIIRSNIPKERLEESNNKKVRLLGGERREKQTGGGHQIRKGAAEMRGQQEGTCGRVRLVEVAPGCLCCLYHRSVCWAWRVCWTPRIPLSLLGFSASSRAA